MAAVGNRSGRAGLRDEQGESGQHSERTGRICLQRRDEVAVHGRLDARRHSAQRARDTGEGPERARKAGVSGQQRENRRGAEHGERRSTRIG